MNPYAPETVTTTSMSELFARHAYIPEKIFNRGDYLKYFSEKTGYGIGFVGMKLKGMQDLRTLAHIKSVCDKDMLESRKTSWKHAFNSVLFVPKEISEIL